LRAWVSTGVYQLPLEPRPDELPPRPDELADLDELEKLRELDESEDFEIRGIVL